MKLIEEHIEEQSDGEVIIHQTVVMDLPPIERITLSLSLIERPAPAMSNRDQLHKKESNGQHTT